MRSHIRPWLLLIVLVTSALRAGTVAVAGDNRPEASGDSVPPGTATGLELFLREWVPDDPRADGGDGLGPLYNDTSCVACHSLGGPGGAGPAGKNVEILTITAPRGPRAALAEIHPGLADSDSVVLHRFGAHPEYARWRLRLFGEDRLADMAESAETEIEQAKGLVDPLRELRGIRGPRMPGGRGTFAVSHRNPPALFGSGLIDSIPDEVLVQAASRSFPGFPEVRGRANPVGSGRLGRFGWKAQAATLEEFVLTACAVELGLEVPGRHQAASPLDPGGNPRGLDLSAEDCRSLVDYVRELPAPTTWHESNGAFRDMRQRGEDQFFGVGCATCHVPKLGEVEGIYSDMLLHSMGRDLADGGRYYGGAPASGRSAGQAADEWRTPPLWGLRDSGPYLHDGRAATLEQAIAFHGGQAERSARRFFELSPEDRGAVLVFLRSLSVSVRSDGDW